MTLLDELAKEYVELLLTKHQHHDIWDVYWYADTPFYKRTDIYVNRNRPAYPYKPAPCMPKMSLEQILEKTNVLYQKLISNDEFENGNDEIRNQYLIEHVRSMIMRTHFLMEKQMSYDEYTYGMFGLKAPVSDINCVDDVIRELDTVLPGKGDLGQRILEYKQRLRIPSDKIPDVLNKAGRFFHEATVENMGTQDSNMPRLRYRKIEEGNVFVTVLYGYDYDKVSLEQNFSTIFPFYLDNIAEVAGHEMEPGHFTFMYLRTKGMVDTSYPELGINSHAPSSAFIEGGARAAIKLVLNSEEKERAFDLEMFNLAGVDKELMEQLPIWRKYIELSSKCKLEIERNLWDKKWSVKEAAEYARAKYFITENQPDDAVRHFANDPGHFTSHDYATSVVNDYYSNRYTETSEKWKAYKQLCQYPFVMKELVDGTFDPFNFKI